MTVSEFDEQPHSLFVTNLPLSWHGYQGQYNPVFNEQGQFTNTWKCDRNFYWLWPLSYNVYIEYLLDDEQWVFRADHKLIANNSKYIFRSLTRASPSHPRLAHWAEHICISHIKPMFWQTL